MYIKVVDAEKILSENRYLRTHSVKCSCGESYCIELNKDEVIVVCDTCYDTAPNKEKY